MNSTLKNILSGLGMLDTFLDYKQKPYIALNKQTAELWQRKIAAYQEGRIPQAELNPLKPELVGQPIIWQYWGQGLDDELPELIRYCFASVDKHKGEYRVIRLSDNSLGEYLQLPDIVAERLQQGEGYTRTFFSDLLRVALLATYGGIWLDATIYLSDELPEYVHRGDFFAYQRSEQEPLSVQRDFRSSYYAYWGWQPEFEVRMLSSLLVAKPQSPLALDLYSLLLAYWQEEESVKDYFVLQVLFNLLAKDRHAYIQREVVSDCLPHLLGLNLCDTTSSTPPNRYSSVQACIS